MIFGFENNDWRFELSVAYHNISNTSEGVETSNDLVFRIRVYKSNIKKGIFIHDKEDEMKQLMEE